MIYDAANPHHVKFLTVLLKGIASACRQLSKAQVDEIGIPGILGPIICDETIGELPDMWADRALGGNAMSSFLADIADDRLERVVGSEAYAKRFILSAQVVVETALKALQQDPVDVASRNIILLVVSDRPVRQELRRLLPDILAKADFVGCLKTAPSKCPHRMLLMSLLAAESLDPALMSKIWSECLSLARHLTDHPPGDEVERLLRVRLALSFTDIAVRLSGEHDREEEGLRQFCEKLTELTNRWPDYARLTGMTMAEMVGRIPTEKINRYYDLVSAMRSCA